MPLRTISLDASGSAAETGVRIALQGVIDCESEIAVGPRCDLSRKVGVHGLTGSFNGFARYPQRQIGDVWSYGLEQGYRDSPRVLD